MENMHLHSVRLDQEKCAGCTNCIQRCPTEAIRVRKGKAIIISERCIDCGECIRACQNNAKLAVTDPFSAIDAFKYKVVMPAPTLYSQYRSSRSRNHLLTALKRMGFDDVYEVALGAEYVSNATIQYLEEYSGPTPVISTACPAIVRLVQVKFPNLIDHLLKLEAPVEVAAQKAREAAKAKTGLSDEEIGIFFITPCAAKMYTKDMPSRGNRKIIDGVISFQDIYIPLREALKSLPEEEEEDLAKATAYGVRWPNPGGESLALSSKNFIAVDEIHEVAKVLEQIENNETLSDIQFIEALACKGGCLGGPLAVKNVYVAQVIMKSIREEAKGKFQVKQLPELEIDYHDIMWDKELEHIPIHKLDENIVEAMKKFTKMDELIDTLPGLDCGACGAPTCKALAEDVIRDTAKITDCVFKLREKVRRLATEMFELESLLPPTLGGDETGRIGEPEPVESVMTYIGSIEPEDKKEGENNIDNKRFGKRYSGDSINWRS